MSEKGKLTQIEADTLLNMLKKTLTKAINFPSQNAATEFNVKGDSPKDIFTIKIYRGKIRHDKYTFGARITKDNTLLLELHINPGNTHINPDDTKIVGSHWHIYREGYDRRFAFPAEDIESDNFVKTTMLFFDTFNIIEKPDVHYQLELLQ